MLSSHSWVLDEFCKESNSHPCSLISSISRLMWRGSSVNSWPNIIKDFTFHKLLCLLIFDNIVCQFFTFYPTWDPIRKWWQAASETRASTATFRSWESFKWLQGTVDQILKKRPKVGVSLYFTVIWNHCSDNRQHSSVYTCDNIRLSQPGQCVYVGVLDLLIHWQRDSKAQS